MNQSRKEALKKVLQQKSQELMGGRTRDLNTLRQSSEIQGNNQVGDLGDKATLLLEDEIRITLAEAKSVTLVHVSLALQRLSQGVYDLCSRCGNEIHDARLEALPFVTTCLACAQHLEEMKEKQKRVSRQTQFSLKSEYE